MNVQKISFNELPYDEVVDMFADGIEVARAVEERAADGLDFGDIFALSGQYPKLIEMYQDRQVFAAQLLDLTPAETEAAWDELAERIGEPRSRVEEIAVRSFNIAGRAYRLYAYNRAELSALVAEAREIGGQFKPAA